MAALFVILSKFVRAILFATVSEFLTTKLFAIIFGIIYGDAICHCV